MKVSKLNKEKYSWLKDSDLYVNIDLDEKKINFPYCSKYTDDIIVFLNVINFLL